MQGECAGEKLVRPEAQDLLSSSWLGKCLERGQMTWALLSGKEIRQVKNAFLVTISKDFREWIILKDASDFDASFQNELNQ